MKSDWPLSLVGVAQERPGFISNSELRLLDFSR
jgi:hypothetical protein